MVSFLYFWMLWLLDCLVPIPSWLSPFDEKSLCINTFPNWLYKDTLTFIMDLMFCFCQWFQMFLTRNENQSIISPFSERAEEASLFPNGSLLLRYTLRRPDMVDDRYSMYWWHCLQPAAKYRWDPLCMYYRYSHSKLFTCSTSLTGNQRSSSLSIAHDPFLKTVFQILQRGFFGKNVSVFGCAQPSATICPFIVISARYFGCCPSIVYTYFYGT